MNWLREMSDEIQAAEPGEAKQPGLAREPIRALLAKTVALGDEAFMALAQLNFQVRENVDYCIFSSPLQRPPNNFFLDLETAKPPVLDEMSARRRLHVLL